MDHGRDTDTQEGPGGLCDYVTISVFKNVIICFRAGIYTDTFGKVDGYLPRNNDID